MKYTGLKVGHNFYDRWVKRGLDILVSLVVLIVASPLLIAISYQVWRHLGWPVFFVQERPGRWEKPFKIYKFRTMKDRKDTSGRVLPDRERLHPVGIWLRERSLDELPEFINILKGDMSLVGPRPLLMRYLPWFHEHERIRFTVRPGLTGIAQVHGRNTISWDQRFKLDADYVRRQSLFLDLRILLDTFAVVAAGSRGGAVADTDETETWLDEERSAMAAMGQPLAKGQPR